MSARLKLSLHVRPEIGEIDILQDHPKHGEIKIGCVYLDADRTAEAIGLAELIATAPDLLEALRAAVAVAELHTGHGVREQPPQWAHNGQGGYDCEEISRRASLRIMRGTNSQ